MAEDITSPQRLYKNVVVGGVFDSAEALSEQHGRSRIVFELEHEAMKTKKN